MRDDIPTTVHDTNRAVCARVRLTPRDRGFASFPGPSEWIHPFVSYTDVHTPGLTGSITRYAIEDKQYIYGATSDYVRRAIFTPVQSGEMSGNGSYPLALPAVTATSEDYRDIAVYDTTDHAWAAYNGIIYKYNPNTTSWDVAADLKDTVTNIVPKISITRAVGSDVAIVAAAVYSGEGVSDHCKLVVIDADGVDTWKGLLPKHSTRPNIAAIMGVQGEQAAESIPVLYIYVDNWNQKKPVMIKRFRKGVWSATKPILPIDALDEESSFTVSHAVDHGQAGVYDRVFLTGILKRQYGPTYAVIMRGPEKFTFDRGMIITLDETEPLNIFFDTSTVNKTWALGKTRSYVSNSTSMLQPPDYIPESIDPTHVTTEHAVNTADRMMFDVPGHYVTDHAEDLIPGARADLYITVNGEEFREGQYAVDRIRKQEGTENASYTVDCSSIALKKMLDWESDTYFDYMGQGEVHGDPGDLTKLIRFSGARFLAPETGGLELESLNDDGMLYTTPPSSHGGFIRCKFTNMQVANTMVGIGLNYGEETLAEAAARLDKKIEDTKGTDRGRWGLFAIYYPDPKGQSGGQVWLCDYNTIRKGYDGDATITNAWKVIQKVNVTQPAANGTAVMAMQYQDSYVRVYYASSDTNTLQPVIFSEAIFEQDVHPSEHENYGRGAIYIRNNTGAHMSFPMSSDCDVVPLHSLAEKYAEVGVPLEDRTDKFPASNGTVLIDSEQILYTGIAGWQNNNGADRRTLDLEWVPGEVLANAGDGATTPTGTNTDFARSRGTRDVVPHVHGNNYVLQSLTIPAGRTITAVRVWLKKVNFPEDSVMLTINLGTIDTKDHLLDMVNFNIANGQMGPGSKITEEGGWVTFFLDRDVEIGASSNYWIMLRRSKNWNHPSSYSYFQYKRMTSTAYSGGGVYHFCEEDDAITTQSGDMAFVVYGKVEGVNKEFCIPVKYGANLGLPDTENFFIGCAVTVTEGEGKNNCYRIIRSKRFTSSLGEKLYLFFVDRSPGEIFDVGSKLRAVPALYGLKRGQSGTIPAAHGGGSFAHLPASVYALASYFEFFTADEDLTLAEVAEEIARKGGVLNIDLGNRATYEYFPNEHQAGSSAPRTSRNMIALLSFDLTTDVVEQAYFSFQHLSFIDPDGWNMSVLFKNETAADGKQYGWLKILAGNNALLSIPVDDAHSGNYRISLYDGHISVWCDGRILGAAHLGEYMYEDWYNGLASVNFAQGRSSTGRLVVPQAGTRVDNFVMDMGKTGAQLLNQLIGEKRIYYRRKDNDDLLIFTDREEYAAAYNRAISITSELTDIGLATRVLLEGGEVVEVSDTGNIAEYGNLFKTVHFSEINNLEDVRYFAEMIREDMLLNRERVEVTGAADPTIEPTDIITLVTKDGAQRQVVVDAVGFDIHVDEAEAAYDMRLSGRFAS